MIPEEEQKEAPKKKEAVDREAQDIADQLLSDLLGDSPVPAPKPGPSTKPEPKPEPKVEVPAPPPKPVEVPKPEDKVEEVVEKREPETGPTPTLEPEPEVEEEPLQIGGAVEYNPHVKKPKALKPAAKPEEKAEKPKKPAPPSNPMKEILIDKVVVNIGVGEAGEKILKAEKVLEMVTGQKPIRTISNTTNKDLGIRKGQDIGCKVTLRGQMAEEFLKRAFWVRENMIWEYSFDQEGNFCFGVNDYTDFKGMKYDPKIGIFGMDISATLKRKGGKRVANRRMLKRKLPHTHRIAREEGIEFARYKFDLEVIK